MKKHKNIWAIPNYENLSIDDCEFYTVQDVPGLDKPTKGEWDLRAGVDNYLGHVEFNGKTVLELGPASGYLTFHMEQMSANVTSIELSLANDRWDVVPMCNINWVAEEKEHRDNNLKKVQNAYWFAHKAFNSNAKIIHSHINDLSDEIGRYDIALMGSVLLHLENPFLAMQNMLRRTNETAIITDLLPGGSRTKKSLRGMLRNIIGKNTEDNMPQIPYMQFLPQLNGPHNFAWWLISPEAIVNMASIFGFEDCKISYHTQIQNGRPNNMFTVVCNRTIPIKDCYYDTIEQTELKN